MVEHGKSEFHIDLLSQLVFASQPVVPYLDDREWNDLFATADTHHVVLRAGAALAKLQSLPPDLELILRKERARIASLMEYLPLLCRELKSAGIPVAVIKSLDHWPDFGSDIDLFTHAPERQVTALLSSRFGAEIIPPALSDRLAGKVNYRIPGVEELVEIHFGRLGQTGEHVEIALRVIGRSHNQDFGGVLLPVPAPEERIMLAALQRMYRHFYIRICDIVNTAHVVESESVDFEELRHASKASGIWPGVATYLHLVSQYLQHYRGAGLKLPYRIPRAARFGLQKVYSHAGFLRLPLFPQAASLYTRQLARSLRRDPAAGLRLSLLPPLAAAAGTKYKITGSDKGVW